MKKIFTSEFIGQFILQVIAIGIVVFLIQGYFNNKWQPLTAAETYPNDIEINSCFSKLCIYSDNPKIPLSYQRLFLNDTAIRPVFEMTTFINLVRQDLGYGDAIIDTTADRYKFIQTHRKR